VELSLIVRTTNSFLVYFKFVFALSVAGVGITWAAGYSAWVGPGIIVALASLALSFMGHPFLKSFAFTVWVFAFVAASMVYPGAFMTWLGYDLKGLIVPLIQIIMFGMGTTLSAADFLRIFKMPWPVFIGFGAQFVIMPLTGLALATVFPFTKGVAAGVVLIGCCPSGVASNVMSYLAGGNVALSVTITSCTTLASPLLTPFLMDRLAGQFVQIEFVKMMFEIVNMIIVPVMAGLIANRLLYGQHKAFQRGGPLAVVAGAALLLALGAWRLAPAALFHIGQVAFQKDGMVVGLLLVGVVAMAKLVVGVLWKGPEDWMDRTLPIVSMGGICCIIAIITARSRDDLMEVGHIVIGAVMIHNAVGYLLGYGLARAARLDEPACRTVAFEVGMQNGGMASALAMNLLKNTQAALAPAIFGPWQNVSGSILATWWRHRPVGGPNPADPPTGP